MLGLSKCSVPFPHHYLCPPFPAHFPPNRKLKQKTALCDSRSVAMRRSRSGSTKPNTKCNSCICMRLCFHSLYSAQNFEIGTRIQPQLYTHNWIWRPPPSRNGSWQFRELWAGPSSNFTVCSYSPLCILFAGYRATQRHPDVSVCHMHQIHSDST